MALVMPRGPIETLASNVYVSDDLDLSTFGSEAGKYSFDQDSDQGASYLLLSICLEPQAAECQRYASIGTNSVGVKGSHSEIDEGLNMPSSIAG